MVKKTTRLRKNDATIESVMRARTASSSSRRQAATPSSSSQPTAYIPVTQTVDERAKHRAKFLASPFSRIRPDASRAYNVERPSAESQAEVFEIPLTVPATTSSKETRKMAVKINTNAHSSFPIKQTNDIDIFRNDCEQIQSRVNSLQQAYDTSHDMPFRESLLTKIAQSTTTNNSTKHSSELSLDKKSSLQASMTEITDTVTKLDRVFLDLASRERQSLNAALVIQSAIRGFLTRCRKLRFTNALSNWRNNTAFPLISSLSSFKLRRDYIARNIVKMHLARLVREKRNVLSSWRKLTVEQLPHVLYRRNVAESKFNFVKTRYRQSLLLAWKEAAIGPRSRKNVKLRFQNRLADARSVLEGMKKFKVITADMVHEEMNKQAVRSIRARHTFHIYNVVWKVLIDDLYLPYKTKYQSATTFYSHNIKVKMWKSWIFFHKSQRHNAPSELVSRGKAGKKFIGGVNVRKIDHFYKTKFKASHFKAWKVTCICYKTVRDRFERATQQKLSSVLKALRTQTSYQAKLRSVVVREWKNYSNRIYNVPFKAWFVYTVERKARHRTQEALLSAYARKRRRQDKYCFFRSWKHHVMYGEVSGVHSRMELIRALEDQKRYSIALEQNCTAFKEVISTLEGQVALEVSRTEKKTQDLENEKQEQQARRMALHKSQQQMALLQSALDSIRQVHPATVTRVWDHLDKETGGGEFDFDLTNLARMRNDDDGAGVDSKTDAEMLQRVKWALSRMSFEPNTEFAESAEALLKREEQVEKLPPLTSEASQMYSLFEFIRTGDTGPLLVESDVKTSPLKRATLLPEDVPTTQKGSQYPELITKGSTWMDFINATARKFPPRRDTPIKDRLLKRISQTAPTNNNFPIADIADASKQHENKIRHDS